MLSLITCSLNNGVIVSVDIRPTSFFHPPSNHLLLLAYFSLSLSLFAIHLLRIFSQSLLFTVSLVLFRLLARSSRLLSLGRRLFLDPCSLTRVGAIMAASVRMVGAELLNRRLRNQITDRDTTMPMHYLWPMPRACYTHTRARANNAKPKRGQPVDGPRSAGVKRNR